jgi:hypothetical protein
MPQQNTQKPMKAIITMALTAGLGSIKLLQPTMQRHGDAAHLSTGKKCSKNPAYGLRMSHDVYLASPVRVIIWGSGTYVESVKR